jgi:HD-GYP domain-containing protein (c-di-GMP phosphodiesterase class II)
MATNKILDLSLTNVTQVSVIKKEEEDNNYVPIPLEQLAHELPVPFDVYVKVKERDSFGVKYLVCCLCGQTFQPKWHEKLQQIKVKNVYITADNRETHLQYLNDLLWNIAKEKDLQLEKRVKVAYSASQQILQEAMERPMPETIKQCDEAARAQVELILNEPDTLLHVLKIGSFDYYTYTHSVNVCFMLIGMLHRLDVKRSRQELNEYCLGALLHDIGKTKIRKDLLNKPGRFSAEEFAEMKKHPSLGVKVVKASYPSLPPKAEAIILHHHEDLDGSGYPLGLTKEVLNVADRLSRIIDIYDALTTNRPYKTAMSPVEAFTLMLKEFSKKIDIGLLKKFIEIVTETPS